MLIIVRLGDGDRVATCQTCGGEEFDIVDREGWKWAFGCIACGRVKAAMQGEPKYRDGNLILEPIATRRKA